MLNKCQFIGHLGNDPEIRSMQSGDEVANFSLAVTEKWKSRDGERKEKTEWVRVVVFNKGLVTLCKNYLKKGSKILLEGSMETRKWTDQSGVEKYSTEVVLRPYKSEIIMLGKRDDMNQDTPTDYNQDTGEFEDEIPF